MKKLTNFFRGLTAMLTLLMMLCMSLTTLTLGNTTWINSNLGISETIKIGGDDGEFAIYWPNEYGYDSEALDKVYVDAAEANIEIAREAVTLLTNHNDALPLASDSKITLYGSGTTGNINHSNSSNDLEFGPISLLEAMQAEFGSENVNPSIVLEASAGSATGYDDVAVVTFSRDGGEGNDPGFYNGDRHYLALTDSEESMMQSLYDMKQAGTLGKIIVLIGTDFAMELDFLDKYGVDACVLAGHFGDYGPQGVAEVLSGKVNPSGKTVDTYASNSLSSPAIVNANDNTYQWSNYDEMGEYDKINNTKNIGYYVIYAEGIYMGYKYYETRYEDVVMGKGNANSTNGSTDGGAWDYSEEMCFPFGYGLSYTTFEQTIKSVSLDAETRNYTITVSVKNTGDVAGKDVIEVYAQTPYGEYEIENKVEKASVNLVGYTKTDLLQPGETKDYTVEVREYFLASYDTYGAGTYILSEGDYYLALGNGAHDALNNILAKKGYTIADGMTANGNADLAYTWTRTEMDDTTYSTSTQTGYKVENVFDDADLNYYEGYEYEYLTRNDWEGTWPVAQQLSATTEMMEKLTNYYYETPENAPSVDSFTQGVDNGLKLSDMIYVDYNDDETWNKFLDQLTIEQLCNTITDSKSVNVISDLDVPGTSKGDDDTNAAGGKITFISHPSTARTWNIEMNELRGKYSGLISILKGTDEIWYGAGNLHRTPYGGRVRQYWSEDANLSYINGYYECMAAQEVGCIICVKHMCCNDQETQRTGLTVFVDEQALREIYLRAFEGSFDGGALSVMTTTGRVGTMLGKNYEPMLTTVLRNEWGFKGHVTSDGYVNTGYYNNTLEELVAGFDYSCCDSRGANADRVLAAIKNGDGYILQCARLAAKRNLYVMTQSASMNGLGSGARIVTVVPEWELAVIAANVVLAGLLAICLVLTILFSIISLCGGHSFSFGGGLSKASLIGAILSAVAAIVAGIHGMMYEQYFDVAVIAGLAVGAVLLVVNSFARIGVIGLVGELSVAFGLGLFITNSYNVWADTWGNISQNGVLFGTFNFFGSEGGPVLPAIIILLGLVAGIFGIVSCFQGKEAD